MIIFDDWKTGDVDKNMESAVQELCFDVSEWPDPATTAGDTRAPPAKPVQYCLRLEDCTHVPIGERIRCHERNFKRLEVAATRVDITHLEIPYASVCPDIIQEKLEFLVRQNDREWSSFSLFNIHRMDDLYARPVDGEKLYLLVSAMKQFKEVHLQGCPASQGHGLDSMLKAIPDFENIKALRLEGWQMDRVAATGLVEAFAWNQHKSITELSLRSCRFQGERTFHQIVEGLSVNAKQLELLNLSFCDLLDQDIIPFIDLMKTHPNLQQLHLGGNTSKSQDTVASIAEWIKDPNCKLTNLNFRALWISYSDDGLLQRLVSFIPLYEALKNNKSIKNFTLSENYLENQDICKLSSALAARPSNTLHHIDVAGNPFQEAGVKSLEIMLHNQKSLVSVHFENDIFPPYQCAASLKFLAQINKVEQKIRLKSSVHTKVQIWPEAFEKVQKTVDDGLVSSSSVIFHLLRSTVGPHGKELAMQIATHK